MERLTVVFSIPSNCDGASRGRVLRHVDHKTCNKGDEESERAVQVLDVVSLWDLEDMEDKDATYANLTENIFGGRVKVG